MAEPCPSSGTTAEAELQREIVRLNKMITALMNRAERDMSLHGSDFCIFQTTVMLEKQVHERTHALEAALQENERITRALKREQEEQRQLILKLEQAHRQLLQSEKLASLGSLVAGVAHELNTPIGNGVMAASTLRHALETFRQRSSEGIKRSLLDAFLDSVDTGTDIAQRNLQRAAELISSFKQVAADQTSSQRRTFRLDEIVHEVALTLRPTLKNRTGELQIDIPPGIEMESYPGPLGQALANLIDNATLHAFEGRSRGSITVSASLLTDGRARLCVEDDGIGIPAKLLPRIFDPFVTTRMGRGGTGLGLHIAHNIAVQVLGGSISANCRPDEGCCFELILPLVAPPPRPVA